MSARSPGIGEDLRLAGRQLYYEQLGFWLNPVGAGFTIGFSVIFLLLLGATGGNQKIASLGGIREIQYYLPGFVAYGVMAACFNTLTNIIVVRRETGLLKRLRLSPLPTWALFAGVFGSMLIVSGLQVIVLLLIGKFGYGAILPHNVAAFVVALVVGSACFCAVGVATSTLIPNEEAAGPVIGVIFFVLLFLSGLWFPINSSSALAKISTWFPVRHMITATFAPFDVRPGVSGWAWNDLLVMAVWGVCGIFVALRRWSWSPRRN
ncbi:MAG: ABC transporter permease [Acidimicrobiales bacterium]